MAQSGKHYLFVSDFDQTLSFNDSGLVLSKLIGVNGFLDRVAGLSDTHLVQQGGELAYLLLHDPEFRRVRREDLAAVGKQIRLKENITLLSDLLPGLDGHEFAFHVVSAAPEEVIQSALEGIVPPDHIHGARFRYSEVTGEIESIVRLPAGYGKAAVVDQLRAEMRIAHDSVIVLSDNACSVLVPILEELFHWNAAQVRLFFESQGLALQEWDKIQTDSITICRTAPLAQIAIQ